MEREIESGFCILVTCYNRIAITLSNLSRLVEALDVAGQPYRLFVLDDASPDGTGDKIRRHLPQAHVLVSEGNLFWNRGMNRLFNEARKHGPFSAYLLYNDDVTIDVDAVREFITCWRQLNLVEPTTLVGATQSFGGERITYSGMRVRWKNAPLSVCHVVPNGKLQMVDTFNANFVLVPAEIMEQLGGTDPFYWHSFGDIDLGLSIGALGQKIYVAARTIGRCEDRPIGVPSRHGLRLRLIKGLTGRQNPMQNIYLTYKHAPSRILASLVITRMLIKRLILLARNGPHEMPASADAKI